MPENSGGDHEKRVADAFDSLHGRVGERLDAESRRSVEELRRAAHVRDSAALRKGLAGVQKQHGWLYRELAEHPAVANLLNELALWGF